jgi:hypothetical protein
VDARNPVHSARGLFQFTAASYHLNPNGVWSFGNAIEEAQGCIRYIQQRHATVTTPSRSGVTAAGIERGAART